MTLQNLGYTQTLEDYRIAENLEGFEVGRITSEHKERYTVKTVTTELEAELIGNLRFTAESRYGFPAVGDWVAISEYDDDKALIHAIYPRRSIIERKAVGRSGQVQIIATNIDIGLIVQAVDRDFNLNRLERYLTICNTSEVKPILVLSKTDLIEKEELDQILNQITTRIGQEEVLTVNNQSEDGYAQIAQLIEKGKTYCLLGSSGVGKSTLLNALSGNELMQTADISSAVNKGKHTTSHRELIVLESGGIIIDNPGMREVGITDLDQGLEATFETILGYAENCKFSNCTHSHEKGCAILQALEEGEINEESYQNFQKLEREKSHFESSVTEKKQKDKKLGKMIREVQNQRKRHKF